jgi:hypothetical protein
MIANVLMACIILSNMVIEDDRQGLGAHHHNAQSPFSNEKGVDICRVCSRHRRN